MTQSIELWQVYYLFCKYTKPSPKNKYIVIMCFDETTPMGILINSTINPFIQARSHLLSCEVKLDQQNHSFLQYDSYLDCREIFAFKETELTDFRGVIHQDRQEDIIKAVTACSVLPLKYKMQIIEQSGLT